MKTISTNKSHHLFIYFLLAFAVSWGTILMVVGPGGIPIRMDQSGDVLPFIYMAMLIGPSFAGILLTVIIDGRAGFKNLLSRLFRWRAGIHWYMIALLATPFLASVILLSLSQFSPDHFPGIFRSGDTYNLLLSGIPMAIMVGLFEELGWTGFAIPRLRQRYSTFNTGLIVGLLWGAWHFILFWEYNSFSETLPLAILLARLFAWLPPFRILMVWVYDRTESLLVIILMHASLVATTLIVVPMTLAGNQLLTWLLLWGAVLWIVIGVIAAFNGGRLPQNQTL